MPSSKLETSKRLIYIFRICLSLFISFSIIKTKTLLKILRDLFKILYALKKKTICFPVTDSRYKSKLPLKDVKRFF